MPGRRRALKHGELVLYEREVGLLSGAHPDRVRAVRDLCKDPYPLLGERVSDPLSEPAVAVCEYRRRSGSDVVRLGVRVEAVEERLALPLNDLAAAGGVEEAFATAASGGLSQCGGAPVRQMFDAAELVDSELECRAANGRLTRSVARPGHQAPKHSCRPLRTALDANLGGHVCRGNRKFLVYRPELGRGARGDGRSPTAGGAAGTPDSGGALAPCHLLCRIRPGP